MHIHMRTCLQIVLTIGDWRNMYLRPYRMQNVMNAFLAVMLIVPVIMLIFSLVSFTQEGQIRDVSYIHSVYHNKMNVQPRWSPGYAAFSANFISQ